MEMGPAEPGNTVKVQSGQDNCPEWINVTAQKQKSACFVRQIQMATKQLINSPERQSFPITERSIN